MFDTTFGGIFMIHLHDRFYSVRNVSLVIAITDSQIQILCIHHTFILGLAKEGLNKNIILILRP
jgi:hypothetical protein